MRVQHGEVVPVDVGGVCGNFVQVGELRDAAHAGVHAHTVVLALDDNTGYFAINLTVTIMAYPGYPCVFSF